MVSCVGSGRRSLKSVPLTGTVALSSGALRIAQLAFLTLFYKNTDKEKEKEDKHKFCDKEYNKK